jgi:hypothetical protein
LYHKSANTINQVNKLSLLKDQIDLNLKKDKEFFNGIGSEHKQMAKKLKNISHIEDFRKLRLESQLSIKTCNKDSKVLIR